MIGIDILQKSRIKNTKHIERLAKRVLVDSEYDIYLKHQDPVSFLAKRFSAKEAVSKALGCGIGADLSFQDIEITNDQRGTPIAKITNKPEIRLQISISDEKDYCVSVCVVISGFSC